MNSVGKKHICLLILVIAFALSSTPAMARQGTAGGQLPGRTFRRNPCATTLQILSGLGDVVDGDRHLDRRMPVPITTERVGTVTAEPGGRLTEEERSLILQSAEHYIEYARSFVA